MVLRPQWPAEKCLNSRKGVRHKQVDLRGIKEKKAGFPMAHLLLVDLLMDLS